ncbi:MAG: flippase-like domain-containing protein [candidate division KSB1 bacterium]|nr:flippase-like domain-containing protein [candidate division KSB1 bacterium]MDZ7385588.1 flippase-like domain-containing protein [candidate division KSB1 bacterium]MDZ7391466.1 flippase-like domain-containing protein [candidate division KSB1 bacterium]
MARNGNRWKMALGIALSIFFLWIAFRKVDAHRMAEAFRQANYWYLLPGVAALFTAHWLRAVRHQYLLDPVKHIRLWPLFSALMVGYFANTLLPAHLGELVRAYVIGRKEKLSGSAVFATIALERVIDMVSLLLITALTLTLRPFPPSVAIPSEVGTSGYLMLGATAALVLFLVLLKVKTEPALRLANSCLRPFGQGLRERALRLLRDFVAGLMPLRRSADYPVVAVISVLLWVGYLVNLYCVMLAFGLAGSGVGLSAALVVLVITTISIVVPSSPGYVGTYHYLAVLSLTLFGVDKSVALSFAVVAHATAVFSVTMVGMACAWSEGVSLSAMSRREHLASHGYDGQRPAGC